MSLYDELDKLDIIERLEPGIRSGRFFIRSPDMKIEANLVIDPFGPWIYARRHPEMKCFLWDKVMFKYFKEEFSSPPSPCHDCYKIVAKPKKVTDLFRIMAWQEKTKYPSKAGLEERPWVHGLYGAYWYTRSMSECKERIEEVRKAVFNISHDILVIAKRGCTEMEMYYGPWDKWTISDNQKYWEKLINKWVVVDLQKPEQSDYFKANVKKRIIKWACNYGDSSYMELNGGKPFHATYKVLEV